MKKFTRYILIVCIALLCAIAFTACNNDEKGYVLQPSAEVEKINVRLPDSNTVYTVSGEEFDRLISALRNQPKLEKNSVVINVGKESVSRTFIYTLSIFTKKQFLKKASTYTVSVGAITNRTDMYGKKSTSTDKDEIRITGYNGTATPELLSLISEIVSREEMKIITTYYDNVRAKLTAEGYTITDMEVNQYVYNDNHTYLDPSNDIKGFYASKDAESIQLILCKTADIANGYTNNNQSGGHVGSIYYRGTAGAYDILHSISLT